MGIRFACPNGHRLNVKAEFAGKRAICPECQAKVIVPTPPAATDPPARSTGEPSPATSPESPPQPSPSMAAPSGEPAPPETTTDSSGASGASAPPRMPSPDAETAPVAGAASVAAPPPASTPPPVSAEQQWHVRAATGDVYGPADAATMQQWIAEGRVAADSWVWRTGWSDWQRGIVALETFNQSPPVDAAGPVLGGSSSDRASAESRPLTAAEQRRRTLARRRRRTVQVTVGLIVVTAILAVVLAVVLLR